jgi:poly-gamma-glutamate synthesis protein (capsule biosynthesis protein)
MAKFKKKVKRIFFLLVLVTLLLGFFGVKYIFNDKKENPIKDIIPKKEEDPIKTYKAKLIATGDGLIHSGLYKAAYNSSTKTYDFSGMLTFTKDKLKDYDIKYYNQETVFDDSKKSESFPRFNTPSQFGEAMIDAGFNMVSLATNHSMDMGGDSAKASAKWWEEHNEILTHGMASSEEKRNDYQIKDANGITYTMLSYTYGTNGLGAAAIKNEPYLVNLFDEEKVKKDIEAVRDKVDVLIVAMHWGAEYRQTATETQKEQAKFLADNGVDIVLGTHSHCIEPWEWIDDTVVFYSFGNFISNQMGAEQASVRKVGVIGMFATLDITKTLDTRDNTKTIKIDNIGADLNYSYRWYDSSISKNNYKVIPFSKMEDKYLNFYYKGKSLQSVYDEYSGILKKYDDSIIIEPLPNKEI